MGRHLFTTQDFIAGGRSERQLHWGAKTGRWVRAAHGVYAAGAEPLDACTRARARIVAAGAVAEGPLAGLLYGLDGLDDHQLIVPGRRRRTFVAPVGGVAAAVSFVDGVRCTGGLQTIVDLAAHLDDLLWEQALESALRKGLFAIETLVAILPALSAARMPGTPRIRRVLALRPPGAPPTESLLETLMVQLARVTPGVPEPTRQVRVENEHGQFVARVDLAWPVLGLFTELDGMQHIGQPVYDATRETAIVAATGWLCGRFTWTDVRRNPRSTGRRLAARVAQARRRPMRAAPVTATAFTATKPT